MNALLLLVLMLHWHAAEPFAFVYASSEPRPEWCKHPHECGDWAMWRMPVIGHRFPLEQLPALRYLAVTSSWDGEEESEFSLELDREHPR